MELTTMTLTTFLTPVLLALALLSTECRLYVAVALTIAVMARLWLQSYATSKAKPTGKVKKMSRMLQVLDDVNKSEDKLEDAYKNLDLSRTVFMVTSAPPCGRYLPVNAKPVDKLTRDTIVNGGTVAVQTPDREINVSDEAEMQKLYYKSAIAVSETMKSTQQPMDNVVVVSSQFWHVLPTGAKLIFGPHCCRTNNTLRSRQLDTIEAADRPARCLSLFLKDGKFEVETLPHECCEWFGQMDSKTQKEMFASIEWVLFNTTSADLMRKHCVTLGWNSPRPYQAQYAADPWTFFMILSSVISGDLHIKHATIDDTDKNGVRWIEKEGRVGQPQTYLIPKMGNSLSTEKHRERAKIFANCWKTAKLALECYLNDRKPSPSEVPQDVKKILLGFPKITAVVHDFCHNDVDDGTLILIIKAIQWYAKAIDIYLGDSKIIEASRVLKSQ